MPRLDHFRLIVCALAVLAGHGTHRKPVIADVECVHVDFVSAEAVSIRQISASSSRVSTAGASLRVSSDDGSDFEFLTFAELPCLQVCVKPPLLLMAARQVSACIMSLASVRLQV
jgi:hypothetical protein